MAGSQIHLQALCHHLLILLLLMKAVCILMLWYSIQHLGLMTEQEVWYLIEFCQGIKKIINYTQSNNLWTSYISLFSFRPNFPTSWQEPNLENVGWAVFALLTAIVSTSLLSTSSGSKSMTSRRVSSHALATTKENNYDKAWILLTSMGRN